MITDVKAEFLRGLRNTRHAVEQMAARCIERYMVEAVIINGATNKRDKGLVRCILCGVCVVLSGQKVVTVYVDNETRRFS